MLGCCLIEKDRNSPTGSDPGTNKSTLEGSTRSSSSFTNLEEWLQSNIAIDEKKKEQTTTNQEIKTKSTTKKAEPKKRNTGTWIEIRLFISSTFIDTHSERDILIKRIIPSINRKIASNFIRIVPVDLRWGVLAEESKDCFEIQKTCLNQVDKCRSDVHWTPWFLGLRTSRYGWVQDSYMESKGFEQPEFYHWLDKLEGSGADLSITSIECIHASNIVGGGITIKKTPKPTVFFYNREIVEDHNSRIPDNLRWIFDFEYVESEIQDRGDIKYQYTVDPEAKRKENDRDKLNQYLMNQNHLLWRDFQAKFSHAKITCKREGAKSFGVGYTKDLDKFEEQVEADLLDAIYENYEMIDNSSIDKFKLETIEHENAIRHKASTFVGRDEMIQQVFSFLKNKATKGSNTMILHGIPGCGKSGVLAAIANRSFSTFRARGSFVFVHVVDSCPGSTLVEKMMRRLQVNLRIFRREHGELNIDRNPPIEASELKKQHHILLNETARKYPDINFIIIVDAVNQFHNSLRSWDMWWLTNEEAPSNLKFLISTLNEENNTFENAKEMCPKAKCISVNEMNRYDLKNMVRATLARFNKKLTETEDPLLGNQMNILLDKSKSPLYLMAACEALRKFGIFEKVSQYLKSLPSTVPELFEFLLEEWSIEYGREFVQDIAAMITVSNDGLLENEIQDILAFKEASEDITYEASFSRIYDSLASFLAAGGGGYLRFFHDQLKYSAKRKFLTREVEMNTHSLIADFFLSVISTQYEEEPSIQPIAYYKHALNQLVLHQLKAHTEGEPMDFLKDSLRNIYFVRERLKAGQQQELNDDYQMVCEVCNDDNELIALKDWISFSQMYEISIQEFDRFALNMAKNQAKTSSVRSDVEKLTCVRGETYPLYWKNSPDEVDPMVVKYVDKGGGDICATSDVVAIARGNLLLVDQSSGQTIHEINIPARSTQLSENGEKVVVGCEDGTVKVVDVSTGLCEISCTENLGGPVLWVYLTDDYIIAASGHGDRAICWDEASLEAMILVASREDGSTINFWNTGEAGYGHYCFLESANMIFTGHRCGIIGWSADGCEIMRQGGNLGDVVYAIAAHPSEKKILSGSNDLKIREWEVDTERKQLRLIHEITDTTSSGWYYGGNWSVSYDHSGTRVLSTEPQSQSLRIYHKEGDLLEELRGHQDCINKISLVNDGHSAVTCDRGGISILWNLPTTSEMRRSKNDRIDDQVLWCSYNPSGTKFVTAAEGVLRLFDSKTLKVEKSQTNVCKHYRLSGKWIDEHHFVVVNTDTSIAWFDSNLNKVSEVQCFPTDDSSCTDIAINCDGTKVVVSDCMNCNAEDSGASIIDCKDITKPFVIQTISDYGARIFACDINKDGNMVVLSGHGGTVVYNLSTLERKYSFNRGCFFVKFTSDDRLIYESDNSLYLYDPSSDEDIVAYKGHTDTVQDAVFLRGEKYIMTAGSEGSIRIYETTSGKNVYGFFSHQAQGYCSLSLHPDEKTVLAADESKLLYVLSTMGENVESEIITTSDKNDNDDVDGSSAMKKGWFYSLFG